MNKRFFLLFVFLALFLVSAGTATAAWQTDGTIITDQFSNPSNIADFDDNTDASVSGGWTSPAYIGYEFDGIFEIESVRLVERTWTRDTSNFVYIQLLQNGVWQNTTQYSNAGFTKQTRTFSINEQAEGLRVYFVVETANAQQVFSLEYNGTPANFNVFAHDSYTSSSLSNFSVDIVNSTDSFSYTTTSGEINTNISSGSTSLYNITISSDESGGYFNQTYTDYNVSTVLNSSLHQAEITFYATNLITGEEITNFTATAPNGQTNTDTNPSLNVTTGSLTYNFTKSGYYPSQVTANLSALETGNATFEVYDQVLEVFLQDINGDSLENFTITVNSTELGVFETNTATTETTTETDNTEYSKTGSGYELVKTFSVGMGTILDSNLQEINYSLRSNSGSFTASARVTVNYEDGTSDSRVDSTTSTSYVDYTYDSSTFTFQNDKDVQNITFEIQSSTGSGTAFLQDTAYLGERAFASFNLTDGNYTVTINDSNYALSSEDVELSSSVNLTNLVLTAFTTNTIDITFKDELTNELINETVTAYFTGSIQSYNYTTSNGTLTAELLEPDTYTITYSAPSYEQREYYFTLENRTYNELTLYLINSTEDDLILVKVTDTLLEPLPDYVVRAQRKNLSGTNYYTVDTCNTDNSGECILKLQLFDVTYRFLIENTAGTTVLTSSDQKVTSTAINFQVDIIEDVLESIENRYKITGDVNYNTGTNQFSFTWNDPSGLNIQACLEIKSQYRGVTTEIDDSCTTGSSGTLTYNQSINDTKSYEARGYVIVEGTQYTIDSLSIEGKQKIGSQMGLNGLFIFGFIVLGIIIFTGMSNPVIPPIIMVVGLILLNILGFVSLGATAITSLAITAGIVIYLSRS